MSPPSSSRPLRRRSRPLPAFDRRELAAVFVGGVLGALARAGLAAAIPAVDVTWPWSTFVANVLGALLLGYFVTRLQERLPVSTYPRPLLGTGLCGALSTFSTMQLELLVMINAHAYGLVLGYAAASVVTGYAAVHLSSALVRRSTLVAAS